MTENLFNPEAFKQMPGQMSMPDVASNPKTWDGEPMYSAETVREAQEIRRDESVAAELGARSAEQLKAVASALSAPRRVCTCVARTSVAVNCPIHGTASQRAES